MFVCVFVACWDHRNSDTRLRSNEITNLRCDDDVRLAAAFWLDEILCAGVRRVATMLTNVSVKFSVDRTRNGRDIR